MKEVPLCSACTRHLKGEHVNASANESSKCSLCFGMLDSHFIDRVAAEVKGNFDKNPYDSTSFVLALNMPVTTILREAILSCINETSFANGTLTSVPFKLRVVQSYIGKIQAATGLRPTLNSDLTLTVTLCNDEFNTSDLAFLMSRFPDQFRVPKKKRRFARDIPIDSIYNKARVTAILKKLNAENTVSYKMSSPTRECTFSVVFEREPIFIASRYCKFSRNLPQSPWTASIDIPKVQGNSVCEKIASPFIREAKCDSTRFIASGREDIDVRMLGSGRPFALQLINPHLTAPFRGEQLDESLKKIAEEINSECDIRLGTALRRISMKATELLKVGQDEKRKSYTAYCYSTQCLDGKVLDEVSSKAPIEISQKTPVRVLKRRPLLDRKRTIFALQALKLDEFHFLIRLETQAGTYVKEFVHGDFGRTRPSLADLLKMEHGEVDILDLDVDNVDMEWPPPDDSLG